MYRIVVRYSLRSLMLAATGWKAAGGLFGLARLGVIVVVAVGAGLGRSGGFRALR